MAVVGRKRSRTLVQNSRVANVRKSHDYTAILGPIRRRTVGGGPQIATIRTSAPCGSTDPAAARDPLEPLAVDVANRTMVMYRTGRCDASGCVSAAVVKAGEC